MIDETDLQRRLTRLAERTAPPPQAALAELVVARHRRQRRRAVGISALAAVVAALVVVSTTTWNGPPPAVPATTTDLGPPVDVLTGPARGSLATDAGFLEGVRQLPWTSPDGGGVPAVPQGARHVVFAGDVTGARWALVAAGDPGGPDAGDVTIAWFSGPRGATPAQMQLDSVPYGVDPTLPLARTDSSTGAMVVVAAPGDEVEVSARPNVAADGRVTRFWTAVDSADGLAVITVPPSGAPYSTATRFRVERAGAEVIASTPDGVPNGDLSAATVPVTWLRGQPAAGDEVMVRSAVQDVLAQTGLSPENVTTTALWLGEVPGPLDRRARVALLAVTLPSGAVYLTAPYDWTGADGGGVDGSCGSSLEPAGIPLEQRALAARCDVFDGEQSASGSSSLVVLAPGESTTRVVDMTGVRLADVPLVDGSTVVPAPQRLGGVEVSGPDPGTTLRLRLLGTADLGD